MNPETLIANGWKSVDPGGFTGHAGPFWVKHTEAGRELGLIVAEHHSNNHIGSLHGGVVMTFADIALGSCVSDATENAPAVTLSLQTQFVSVARVGDFLTCQAEIVRKARQVVFVRGLILAEDKVIASAEGIWKLLEPRKG